MVKQPGKPPTAAYRRWAENELWIALWKTSTILLADDIRQFVDETLDQIEEQRA